MSYTSVKKLVQRKRLVPRYGSLGAISADVAVQGGTIHTDPDGSQYFVSVFGKMPIKTCPDGYHHPFEAPLSCVPDVGVPGCGPIGKSNIQMAFSPNPEGFECVPVGSPSVYDGSPGGILPELGSQVGVGSGGRVRWTSPYDKNVYIDGTVQADDSIVWEETLDTNFHYQDMVDHPQSGLSFTDAFKQAMATPTQIRLRKVAGALYSLYPGNNDGVCVNAQYPPPRPWGWGGEISGALQSQFVGKPVKGWAAPCISSYVFNKWVTPTKEWLDYLNSLRKFWQDTLASPAMNMDSSQQAVRDNITKALNGDLPLVSIPIVGRQHLNQACVTKDGAQCKCGSYGCGSFVDKGIGVFYGPNTNGKVGFFPHTYYQGSNDFGFFGMKKPTDVFKYTAGAVTGAVNVVANTVIGPLQEIFGKFGCTPAGAAAATAALGPAATVGWNILCPGGNTGASPCPAGYVYDKPSNTCSPIPKPTPWGTYALVGGVGVLAFFALSKKKKKK